MGRVRDITEKLSFEENPTIVIRGKALEVNADAPTVLKVMGLVGGGTAGAAELLEAYKLVFPETSRKAIEDMKLNFNDLIIVIQEGISLITGEGEASGEH